jgi:hypothetical protein
MAVNGCGENKNPGVIQVTILHRGECEAKIKQKWAGGWTANDHEGRGTSEEAVNAGGLYSVIIIITGKKNKNVVLVDVGLFHGCGEIALHRAH